MFLKLEVNLEEGNLAKWNKPGFTEAESKLVIHKAYGWGLGGGDTLFNWHKVLIMNE